ncbi:unnamed protein product [Chrysodeixis includens]|uniref:Uncharacterized protein n=1 Tax=Chrysodeixis includens TaxID=689277 RepID=A0A9N8L0F6_CHRIL|nr:unnamed protein product [Chrysodeixis includens]
MSKFTCFVLCAVAVSLSSVHAKLSDEEKAAIHQAVLPILTECSQAHGVSEADIKTAKEDRNTDNLNSCFIGCFFKKMNVLDAEGKYNVDEGLNNLSKYIKSDEDRAKLEAVAKECGTVNDEAVSDGAAGCERAQLLVACALAHKAEAIGDKEREAIRESLSPIIDECGQGHDNDAGSCFAGCFFGKLGVVDADGVYNPDNAIKSINAYLKGFGNLSRFEEVAKKCTRVNERPVSKGNEICERSQMAVDCGLEHKYAVTDEEKAAIRDVLQPIITECSEEHGVSEGDIEAAEKAANAEAIKPCFLGCILKKTNVLDSHGKYNMEESLEQLKKFVKSEEDIAKFEEVGKLCSSVNDQEVSDGEEGCERAKLLIACYFEHKAEMPV